VREFRYLLVRTYGAALHEKRGRKIVYLPFYGRPGDKTAVVRTEVRHAGGGANVQIGYSFYRAESIWKLYDITIDGVSLVTTYRRTYAETIDNKGLDALIADIARTNRQPARASGRAEDAGPKGRARK
jgi:phospholipid transport system substrate-binding protein